MVITHGEPHAGNVMTTPGGLALVDWDTVLLAPPERDLWDMAGDDGSLLGHYTRATGIQIDPEALALYRLWFDLAEISEYLTLFRAPHGDTADAAEAWENLRHFLRPAERWPALCNPRPRSTRARSYHLGQPPGHGWNQRDQPTASHAGSTLRSRRNE
jgi:aminoglycoside phosphotransferase (APT) family kinase protein